jgi:hypothetical protein
MNKPKYNIDDFVKYTSKFRSEEGVETIGVRTACVTGVGYKYGNTNPDGGRIYNYSLTDGSISFQRAEHELSD